MLDNRPGIIVFRASGDDQLFRNEAGCHRIQRVPNTEKRGRVHTSSITIAVLDEAQKVAVEICEDDLEWQFIRGSGNGGQRRNKVSSAVQLTHIPTGIMIRCEQERSQWQNRQIALDLLRQKLYDTQYETATNKEAQDRKQQVGSGMRGEKRRTVAFQRGEVIDHITGKHWRLKDYLRGEWK